jgi:hypothetical protein
MSGLSQIEMSGSGYRSRHDAGAPDDEPTRDQPGGVDAAHSGATCHAGPGGRAPSGEPATGRAHVPRVQGRRSRRARVEEARATECATATRTCRRLLEARTMPRGRAPRSERRLARGGESRRRRRCRASPRIQPVLGDSTTTAIGSGPSTPQGTVSLFLSGKKGFGTAPVVLSSFWTYAFQWVGRARAELRSPGERLAVPSACATAARPLSRRMGESAKTTGVRVGSRSVVVAGLHGHAASHCGSSSSFIQRRT